MRLATKTFMHGSSGSGAADAKDSKESKEGDIAGTAVTSNWGGSAEEKAQAKYVSSSNGANKENKDTAKASAKPAWAMSEAAAEAQLDEMQMEEEDDLIEFAKGLDFDKYMGDVEVQAVMERLRRRIADLEREVNVEDLRNADAETRAAMRAKLEQMVSWCFIVLRYF